MPPITSDALPPAATCCPATPPQWESELEAAVDSLLEADLEEVTNVETDWWRWLCEHRRMHAASQLPTITENGDLESIQQRMVAQTQHLRCLSDSLCSWTQVPSEASRPPCSDLASDPSRFDEGPCMATRSKRRATDHASHNRSPCLSPDSDPQCLPLAAQAPEAPSYLLSPMETPQTPAAGLSKCPAMSAAAVGPRRKANGAAASTECPTPVHTNPKSESRGMPRGMTSSTAPKPPRKTAPKPSRKRAPKLAARKRPREQDSAMDHLAASATAPSALGSGAPHTKSQLVPPEVPPASPLGALPRGEAVTVVYHRGWFQTQRFDKNNDRCAKFVADLEEEMTTFAALCGRKVACQFAYNREWQDKLDAFLSASGLVAADAPADSSSPDSDSRPVLRRHVQPKRHKKVIAYSLFGGLYGGIGWNSTVHPAMEYIVGAWENCAKARQYYSDWVVRIYYDQSMSAPVLRRLANNENLELVYVHNPLTDGDDGTSEDELMEVLANAPVPAHFSVHVRALSPAHAHAHVHAHIHAHVPACANIHVHRLSLLIRIPMPHARAHVSRGYSLYTNAEQIHTFSGFSQFSV